jgi:hypothetical protein
VWGEYLLPLLTCKDTARLGSTCKALRGVVREHFTDVGTMGLQQLQAMLTTFPRARRMTRPESMEEWTSGETEALVEWLREGGRGRHIEALRVERMYPPAGDFVHKALQGGALPSLKRVDASLEYERHRASLTGGIMGAMHELRLIVNCREILSNLKRQLAALGLVRELPALTKLEVCVYGETDHQHHPKPWPPFIPPSLRALRINMEECGNSPTVELLLPALPDMIGASGARLDRLEIAIPSIIEYVGDGLVHVAQALRCCSPTLTGFRIATTSRGTLVVDQDEYEDEDAYAAQMERLRVQWTDVLAGVSACRELQVLVLPPIEVEPLFPPGTAFGRLTHLEICDTGRKHLPDVGEMGPWEMMASGGLPAVAKLSVRLEGRWGSVKEVRSRVAPAFEAVAGTLTHLCLDRDCFNGVWMDDEEDMGYELGVAVGKLRRLKDLTLCLSQDGQFYQTLAQGLAASGGDHPLPLLWRLDLLRAISHDIDLLTSLLLPSVRVFISSHINSRAALVMACALRQAGYKHNWAIYCGHSHPVTARQLLGAVRSTAPCCCRLDLPGYPPWTILPGCALPCPSDDP